MVEAVAWMEGNDHLQKEAISELMAAPGDNDEPKPHREPVRLLPAALFGSFLLGAMCMLVCQLQLVEKLCGRAHVYHTFIAIFSSLYVVTLGCMAYTTLCDPGQLSARSTFAIKIPWPKRSHKAWQFDRPIRRYDHYCRWVNNCIGLSNHRELFVMLNGLIAIFVLGALVDLLLYLRIATLATQVATYVDMSLLFLHLVYSVTFGYYAIPVLRLHVGFISRNELANEFKNDDFYIVMDTVTGQPVWVGELDAEDFDLRMDTFEYDPTRNPYDRGCCSNWWAFWCAPRCSEEQLGEF